MVRLSGGVQYAESVSAYCTAVKQSAPAGGLDQANLSVSAIGAGAPDLDDEAFMPTRQR